MSERKTRLLDTWSQSLVLPLPIKDDASILTHNVEVPQCITDSSFALNRGRTTHHDSYLLDLKPSGEVGLGLGGGERERWRCGAGGEFYC